MFACPRDSGANVLRLGFREGTVSKFGRNAYHAFTGTPFLYRLNAGQRKGTSDRKGWQGQPTWVYFPQGAVLP